MKQNLRRFAALLVILTLCVGLFTVFSAVSAAESAELTYLAGGKDFSTQSCAVGDTVTLPAYNGVVPEHHVFLGWTESTLSDTEQAPHYRAAGDSYTVSSPSKTFYALFSHGDLSGDASYFLTAPAAISDNDSVIVAMSANGSTYALDNSCGTAAPNAVTLNISDDAVTGFVGEEIKWNLAEENGSLILYPEGTRSNWLLCSGNPRVGTVATYRAFEIRSNFLYATAKARYLGVDTANGVWIGAGTNYDALAGQKLAFYVRAGGSPVFYTTDANTCAHDWQTASVTAPTCTLSGYTVLQCSLCGETAHANELAAAGHSYVVSTVAPTAGEQGYDNHVCALCGDTFRDCYTDALGDGFSIRFAVPSGVTPIAEMTCDRLGIVLPAPDGKPSDNTYSYVFKGWVSEAVDNVQSAPAVLKAGSSYLATQNTTLRALYQYSTSGEIATPQLTRVLSGETLADGDKLVIVSAGTTFGMMQQTSEKSSSHVANFSFYGDAASVENLQYLTVSKSAAANTFILGDETNGYLFNPAANTDLFISEDALDWTLLDLGDDTFMFYAGTHYLACRTDLSTSLANLWRTCSITATTPRELELYRYTSGQNGSTYYTTAIGDSEHTHVVQFSAEQPASCTSAGTAAYYCCTAADCPDSGLKYADETLQTVLNDVHIPALGHNMQAGEVHTEGCTTDGYTENVCTRCGITQESATVPAHGHDFSLPSAANDNTLYQAPACLQDGFIYYTCSYCGQLDTQPTVLPATGHSPVTDEAVTATCTTVGKTVGSHCSLCAEVLQAQETVAAIGHSYTSAVTTPSGCTTDGERTYTCSYCGESYTQTISATGHTYHESSVAVSDVETHRLSVTFTCTVCGDTYVADSREVSFVDNLDGTHTFSCITFDYTETEPHSFTNGVCLCGATQSTGATLDTGLDFLSNVFTMGSSLNMVYQFSQPNVNAYADAYIVVEKENANSAPTTITFHKEDFAKLGTVRYRVSFSDIAAKELGDSFHATIYGVDADGNLYCGTTVEMSLKAYIMEILKGTAPAQVRMKPLCVALLNYGAAAQLYFDYDTGNLVNADLTEEQQALSTQSAPLASDSQLIGSNTGYSCKYVTATPTLGSKVTLAVSYNAAALVDRLAELDVVVTNAETGVEIERSKLTRTSTTSPIAKAYFSDISASNMRMLFNVAVYDGETQVSPVLTWSVESYVAKTAETSANASMVELASTLLAYGSAAAAYLAG